MKRKIELILFIILIFVLLFISYLKFFVKVKNIEVFGYNFFIVKTGSMEPVIDSGELIIVKRQCDYKKGEIITYEENDIYITHRIIAKNDNTYITKGESNNENDLEIMNDVILGKVIFHSKFLGKLITDYLIYIIILYVGINCILYFYNFNEKEANLDEIK